MSLPRGLLVHPDELDALWIERLRGSSIKTVGLHPVGGKKAHESLEELYQAVRRGEFEDRFARLREMGIELEYEVHAMSWLLPRELFSAHPDWFRENEEGERVADFNLCVSSKGALDHIAERAAELARVLRPTTHRYHLWIDDVRQSFCHCEKCRKLTPSDQVLTVYNALLHGIRRVQPPPAPPPSLRPDRPFPLQPILPLRCPVSQLSPLRRMCCPVPRIPSIPPTVLIRAAPMVALRTAPTVAARALRASKTSGQCPAYIVKAP